MGFWSRLTGSEESDLRARLGRLYDEVAALVPEAPEDELKRIAGYAGLLGSVADADSVMTAEEIGRIGAILRDRLRLEPERIQPILALLRDHRVDLLALEGHLYARLINEIAERGQRIELLRALLQVAAVDGSINAEEDRTLWMLADALNLPHRDFVDVRAEFSRHRDVMRD